MSDQQARSNWVQEGHVAGQPGGAAQQQQNVYWQGISGQGGSVDGNSLGQGTFAAGGEGQFDGQQQMGVGGSKGAINMSVPVPPANRDNNQKDDKAMASKRRKMNHKAIEQRRRETINEGINELKKLISDNCPEEKNEKFNKANILRKAVSMIQDLEERCSTLIAENTRLLEVNAKLKRDDGKESANGKEGGK